LDGLVAYAWSVSQSEKEQTQRNAMHQD